MTQDKPPLPEPAHTVKVWGLAEETYTAGQMHFYADTCTAALQARVAELEEDALKLRGQYGVALDLLTECVYPMKVCAAVVENEVDDDGLERLIEQVREFVAHARGLKKGDTPSTEGEQG